MNNKLMRSANGQLAGVAAGLAKYFDIDVTIVRLLFVLFTLLGGPGILVYIIMAIVMPEEGKFYDSDVVVEKEPMAA
ncbi:MAG: PspC domain-containing protein [Chloroflexota bacterium]